jgi:type IV pilus assembly protein PilY1
LPAGVVDPITLSCQSNYHILFTDGTTNQPNIPTVAGVVDNDENEPASFPPEIPPDNVLPNLNPNVGKPWQRPFRQGATPVSSSLSDIATYYWATDLRPLKNDVPAFPGKISATSTPPVKEGDGDWELDVAWWQHLNFSAISFGAEGTLDASNQTAVMQDIFSGAQNWPSFQNPNNPKTVGGAPVSRPAFAVDDLWHATVNSRGKFVYAKAPIEVAQGLANILAGIANSRKARVGTTFGGGQVLDSTNNIVFEATVEPGWGGNLAKVQIDPATANESATLWNTRDTLAAQLKPTPADAEPWFDNRRIVTLDTAGTPVPFRHPSDPGPTSGNLDATQLATLSASTLQQRKIVAYLRGGSTFAGQPIEGTSIGQFRKRFSAMGDISNSQPVVVGAPVKDIISNDAVFSDINDPGYKAFWDAHQSRSERIYVGANDGMLHAFDSSNGNEVFAYVPRAVIRSTLDATGKPDGIQALTYQDGGVPIFKHHMYVDGPVTTADVDFGGSDWHTILVGGLGKGGNAYYALDVTDPAAADEGAAAAKILWEFHDSDMNYSYGRPIIAKTYAFGWTVILTASYNNPSGFGKVYFLNPRTGAVLATLSTSAGSGTTPSGLTQLSGFTKDYHNQFVEQLYGGDLLGNVWRFDVHDPDPANWTTVKLAQLTDGAGNPQPVTTAPQIEIDFANGADRWVFVGTGQLLDTSDFNNPSPQQQQTMYAIRDGTLAAIETTGLPRTRATLPAVTSDAGLASSSATGWKFDLPIGERIVVNPEADLNVLVFAGTQAPTDPCVTSLPANIYAREFSTGASLIADAGGNRLTSFFSNDGAVGTTIVSVQDSSAGALPVLKVVFTRETNASIVPVSIIPPNLGSGHRFSIRMLGGR